MSVEIDTKGMAPKAKTDRGGGREYPTIFYLLIITTVSVFIAETFVIIVLRVPRFALAETLLYIIFLIILVFPMFYFILMRLLIRQISERKKSEAMLKTYAEDLEGMVDERTKELRKSEGEYRSIIENSPDGIVRERVKDGELLSINPTGREIYEHESEELIGKSTLNLQFWVDPDDRYRLIRLLEKDMVVRDFE